MPCLAPGKFEHGRVRGLLSSARSAPSGIRDQLAQDQAAIIGSSIHSFTHSFIPYPVIEPSPVLDSISGIRAHRTSSTQYPWVWGARQRLDPVWRPQYPKKKTTLTTDILATGNQHFLVIGEKNV